VAIEIAAAAKPTNFIDGLPPELLEKILLKVVDDMHPPSYLNSSGCMRF
jgi:hypothetical protein